MNSKAHVLVFTTNNVTLRQSCSEEPLAFSDEVYIVKTGHLLTGGIAFISVKKNTFAFEVQACSDAVIQLYHDDVALPPYTEVDCQSPEKGNVGAAPFRGSGMAFYFLGIKGDLWNQN